MPKKLYESGPSWTDKASDYLRSSALGKAAGLNPPKDRSPTRAEPLGYSGGKARAAARKKSGQEDGGLGG